MIDQSGRFSYLAVVPETRDADGFECAAKACASAAAEAPHSEGRMLVGAVPTVRITNAGLTDDPHLRPPWSLRARSRIALIASASERAWAADASFCVDKAIVDATRAGDQMHFVRNAAASLGFSLIRGRKLIAAVGAVTSVQLGDGVEARTPSDLIAAAEQAFQERDPDFEFVVGPVEITIKGVRERYGRLSMKIDRKDLATSFVSFGGVLFVGDYRVIVRHGSFRLPGGPSESVAICDRHMLTHAAGEFSAMLLDDGEALEMLP